MNLTAQQIAFKNELLDSSSNIALLARAGTGKTSTILAGVVEYARKFPNHEITICAFGKAIQTEIAAKLAAAGLNDWRRVQAATSHSMGWSLVRFAFKGCAIDDRKVLNIIDDLAICDDNAREFAAPIKDLVHLAKTEGFGFFDDCHIGDLHAWYRLAEHYAVNGFEDTSDMDKAVRIAQQVYKISLGQTHVVDFDDMILFPLVKNLRVRFQRDLLIVDEAQDTSRARRALLRKFVKRSGRMIVVGDDRQAIMGFAGASADAMGELIRELDAKVLPLTMTWRCPRAVVAEAQRIVPDIQAQPNAIEGTVERATEFPELTKDDAILCRNTAPLIDKAYKFIRQGIACKVEGRDIGAGLLKMVNRWKVKSIDKFLVRLEEWAEREIQKLNAKKRESKIPEIEDKYETLRVICNACLQEGKSGLADVRQFIEDMFDDDVTDVLTLCTYHRSKGREWPTVVLVEHASRCPSPFAKQEWEKRQEANLAYVAITRAQEKLVYLN